jgi:glutamyl-Q tRNA(Asp) synthetase
VLDAQGEKLSKQTGAQALDTRDPLTAVRAAASVLGLEAQGVDLGSLLAALVAAWRARWL